MLYPTLKLVISVQDQLLFRDITDPTRLNSVLLRAINTARRDLEQAADLLRRQYAAPDNPESHWNNPWTSQRPPGHLHPRAKAPQGGRALRGRPAAHDGRRSRRGAGSKPAHILRPPAFL